MGLSFGIPGHLQIACSLAAVRDRQERVESASSRNFRSLPEDFSVPQDRFPSCGDSELR